MNQEEQQQNDARAEELLFEQNFKAAVIAGAVATLLAAIAYGLVVNFWAFAYGFAAAGVGLVVGAAVGFLGRGVTTKFSVLAASYAIVGCFLGNICLALLHMTNAHTSPAAEIVDEALGYITIGHSIYWFVAVFAAVFLGKRALSRKDHFALRSYEQKR